MLRLATLFGFVLRLGASVASLSSLEVVVAAGTALPSSIWESKVLGGFLLDSWALLLV
jgi:hypothetical protein